MTASSAVHNGVGFLLNTGDAIDELPGDTLSTRTGRGYERELRTGLRILIVATVLGGGWMTFVPLAGAVVVPGNLPARPLKNGQPGPSTACAVIVKRVDERTRAKTSINELLRD